MQCYYIIHSLYSNFENNPNIVHYTFVFLSLKSRIMLKIWVDYITYPSLSFGLMFSMNKLRPYYFCGGAAGFSGMNTTEVMLGPSQ